MKAKPAVEKERVVNGRYAATRYPKSATSVEELAEMRRRAWVKQGLACLQVDQIGDDWLRISIENLCRELYGPRQPPPAMRQTHNSP